MSQPDHYVLDRLGATVVAAEADKDPDQTHWHVATATRGPTQRPHGAIWAPIGYDGHPMRLADLATVPAPPES